MSFAQFVAKLFSMWNSGQEPSPELVEEPVVPTFDYVWEESDNRIGYSYVMPPAGVRCQSITINDTPFEFHMIWKSNNREIWYGPSRTWFSGTVTIVITELSGVSHTDTFQKVKEPRIEIPPKELPVKEEPPIDFPPGDGEVGRYHRRANGDRPIWYFKKNMEKYPKSFRVVIPGFIDEVVVNQDGKRYNGKSGGLLIKQSDVSGRGMAIICSSAYKGRQCKIYF